MLVLGEVGPPVSFAICVRMEYWPIRYAIVGRFPIYNDCCCNLKIEFANLILRGGSCEGF